MAARQRGTGAVRSAHRVAARLADGGAATGRLALNGKMFGKQCKYHPELRSLQKLRDQIAELRLSAFLNTIGADGMSRCPIMPFWTRSGAPGCPRSCGEYHG